MWIGKHQLFLSLSQLLESGFHYAKTHEWVSLSDSMIATVGIADYAQVILADCWTVLWNIVCLMNRKN